MSSSTHRFATAINCMDGRAVDATSHYVRTTYDVHFVDQITEPGMDGHLLTIDEVAREALKRKLSISLLHHGSRHVAVVGHSDCAGHPVPDELHCDAVTGNCHTIRQIVAEIDPTLEVTIIPLFVRPGESGVWIAEHVR
jgi:carbonic anhydrase